MKRRFILLTENLTSDQESHLQVALGTPYWWHWLPNAWLMVDYVGIISVDSIRREFAQIAPQAQCLVLEVDAKNWAAMQRKFETGSLSTWIESTWFPA